MRGRGRNDDSMATGKSTELNITFASCDCTLRADILIGMNKKFTRFISVLQ